MKNKIFGIYAKVFSYTVLILVAVIVVAAAFFSNQIGEIMQVMERQQLTNIFGNYIHLYTTFTPAGEF